MHANVKRWQGIMLFGWAAVAATVSGQTHPRTLSVVPIGGNTITSGSPVAVEVLITNVSSSVQLYREVTVALFCDVTAAPDGNGVLTAIAITTDPDGDGVHGPSASGIPILFEYGAHPTNESSCRAAARAFPGNPPTTALEPGETRYLMTVVYQLTDYQPKGCTQADFEILLKCGAFDVCDGEACYCLTELRDETDMPVPFNAQIAVIAAGDGVQCDDGQGCTMNDVCGGGTCTGTYHSRFYGDLVVDPNGDGYPDIADVLCSTDGFQDFSMCPQADISPCGGDGIIDVSDVLAVVEAFAGFFACPDPCP